MPGEMTNPRNILVVIHQPKRSWWKRLLRRDRPAIISGVTYGGVAMTRAIGSLDTPGEPFAYFLGGPIPTEKAPDARRL